MFGWESCSRFNFIPVFLNLAKFATLFDDTKKTADLSKILTNFRLKFYVSIKCVREAISTPSLAALHISSQKLDRKAVFPSTYPTKIARVS